MQGIMLFVGLAIVSVPIGYWLGGLPKGFPNKDE